MGKARIRGIQAAILTCLLIGVLVFVVAHSDESEPGWKSEMYDHKRLDAQARVRTTVAPSYYALDKLPADMASGEWSSSRNLMDCRNPGETTCFEIDFESPSGNVKCKWLVSYDRATADFIDLRPLNAAATNLFERIARDDETRANLDPDSVFFERHDGSPTSDAISLIKASYAPRDPGTYSSIQAGWFAVKKNTLANDDEVISVRFTESKADPLCEWVVEVKPSIHDHYKLIRANNAASTIFVAKAR